MRQARRACGCAAGWLNLLGQIGLTASVASCSANHIAAMWVIYNGHVFEQEELLLTYACAACMPPIPTLHAPERSLLSKHGLHLTASNDILQQHFFCSRLLLCHLPRQVRRIYVNTGLLTGRAWLLSSMHWHGMLCGSPAVNGMLS